MALQEDLLELGIIDKRAVKAAVDQDVDDLIPAVREYQTLRKSIRTRLLPQSVASVHDASAADILRKITTGAGLPTDRIIDHMLSMTGSDQLPDEFSDEDMDTIGSDLFYSWFSHFEYVTGLSELRPLVIRTPVRGNIVQMVKQIKDCYAFQQYEATYSLCRTVIESSIRDICVRCNLFPDLEENVILFEKFTWRELREKVSSGSLEDDLKQIYSDLSMALHGRKTVSKDEARLAFEKTLQAVERLYMEHGL
ncbi:MAG: hypothetical protein ABIN18_03020 [Pseudomonadota bacterium]